MRKSSFARVAFGALTVFALCLPANDALAKKDKSGGDEAEIMQIEETGVASFDEVFTKAGALNQRLIDANTELTNLNNAVVTAMGLPEGTPIGDALDQMKADAPGMITVTMNGAVPSVEVNPEAPDNVKAGIEAVKAAATAIPNIIDGLKSLPDDAKEVVAAATALPAQVAAEVSAGNIAPADSLSMGKKVKNNVKATTAIPSTASALVTNATGTLEQIAGLAN